VKLSKSYYKTRVLFLTIFMILVNRLEVVDFKKPRGLAKVFGTVLSLIGAFIMTLYKGHTIQSLRGAPFHVRGNFVHNNWVKGSLLAGASCISWSLWFILQVLLSIYNQAIHSMANCAVFHEADSERLQGIEIPFI